MRIAVITLPLLLLPGVVACGGGFPPPKDQWDAAKLDVAKAEGSVEEAARAAAGPSEGVASAQAHLKVAQEDLGTAQPLINDEPKRAASLIELSKAEAQLAVSLAKQDLAQRAAQKALSDLQKVKGGG